MAPPVTLPPDSDEVWSLEIGARDGLLSIPFAEIWRYRDLLLLLVYRDFVSLYKQTILGPLWFLIQPIMTTIVFTIVFGQIAGISTDGVPQVLFYLSGITCWSYFSECLTKTSETFTMNANIFGKVYFPRVIIPLSIVVSNLLRFGVQFVLFLGFCFWFAVRGAALQFNWVVCLFPLLVLLMGLLSFSLGMIISSLTTKYRDLRFLLQFAVQLLMYATPVIYPVSALPQQYRGWILANPLTAIVETFRFGFLGAGEFEPLQLAYSAVVAIFLMCVGLVVFNRVEKTFMDTV
jgi:lipopolysaccharide transport system permease protein